MLSTKHTAHIIRYIPPTGTPHKSQNQLVVRYYNTYLVQPRQTGTTEEIEWFSIKRRHTVLGDVRCAITAVFTVPYICNRVGTVSSCGGTRYRTHRRDRTGMNVRSTIAPVRRGVFRFSSAPIGEIAPGVRQN